MKKSIIRKMHKEGISGVDIAKAMGCSPQYISKIIRTGKITKRNVTADTWRPPKGYIPPDRDEELDAFGMDRLIELFSLNPAFKAKIKSDYVCYAADISLILE